MAVRMISTRLNVIPAIVMGVGIAVLVYWMAGLLEGQNQPPAGPPAPIGAPASGSAEDISALE